MVEQMHLRDKKVPQKLTVKVVGLNQSDQEQDILAALVIM